MKKTLVVYKLKIIKEILTWLVIFAANIKTVQTISNVTNVVLTDKTQENLISYLYYILL